jgi:hypothetical protein
MQHEEYKEALSLDALNALEAAQRCALHEHLLTCSPCYDEWRALRDTAASLIYTVAPVAPPAELRARILREVRESSGQKNGRTGTDERSGGAREDETSVGVEGASVGVEGTSSAEPRRAEVIAMPGASERALRAAGRRPVFRYGAIAAALAIAALGVALFALWRENMAMRVEVARLAATSTQTQTEMASQREELERERGVRELLTAPGARIAQLTGTAVARGATARLAYDQTTGRALLVAHSLPPAPAGKAYQLWFIKGGKPLPGGVFKTNEAGGASVSEQVPVEGRDASAFAVTLEREQGETAPKGEVYLQTTTS